MRVLLGGGVLLGSCPLRVRGKRRARQGGGRGLGCPHWKPVCARTCPSAAQKTVIVHIWCQAKTLLARWAKITVDKFYGKSIKENNMVKKALVHY